MFTLGKSDAGRKYPLKDGAPKTVMLLDRDVATMIDVDKWLNPLKTTCDAYVVTDVGVHLFWLAPNKPTEAEAALADKQHVDLNRELGFPMFFEAKHTGKLRSCVAVTPAGMQIAAAYNSLAITQHEQRLKAEAAAAEEKQRQEGLNWLGRLLMQVRDELRSSTSAPQP